jgi:hypothetical protein
MEVYAVLKEFAEWGKRVYPRLPTPLRNGLKAAGVCHFVVVFKKSESGEYILYEFGPVGGDVTGVFGGGTGGGGGGGGGAGRRAWRETPSDRAAAATMRKCASDSSLLASTSSPTQGDSDNSDNATTTTIHSSTRRRSDESHSGGAPAAMRRSASVRRLAAGEIREERLDALPEAGRCTFD